MKKNLHTVGFIFLLINVLIGLSAGAAVAAGVLVLKPVVKVKELPPAEKRVPGAVYLIEGKRYEPGNSNQWRLKMQAVLNGVPGDYQFSEAELNEWFGSTFGEQRAKMHAELFGLKIEPALPVFRLDGKSLQVSLSLGLDSGDTKQPLVLQTSGHIERSGSQLVYSPDRFYIGSCPVPGVNRLAHLLYTSTSRFFTVPADVKKGWGNVSSVAVNDSKLEISVASK